MPIPDSTLSRWGHHYSKEAPKQAHESISHALASYKGWTTESRCEEVFLQGSYKNDTNLRRDSDVDVVVRLPARLRPQVAALSGDQLAKSQTHKLILSRWQLFRGQVLEALRATYGTKTVTSGHKSLKLSKGKIPAKADVVVTLSYGTGIAFYLPKERRWVVSYPKQHQERGLLKEQAVNNRYKSTVRIFKNARNYLIQGHAIKDGAAPSYFIECLLYNIPDDRFTPSFVETYCGIVKYLAAANLEQFKCQNGVLKLFGTSGDQWDVDEAQIFIQALRRLWKKWPKPA